MAVARPSRRSSLPWKRWLRRSPRREGPGGDLDGLALGLAPLGRASTKQQPRTRRCTPAKGRGLKAPETTWQKVSSPRPGADDLGGQGHDHADDEFMGDDVEDRVRQAGSSGRAPRP